REFRFEGSGEHFDPSGFVKGAAGDLNFTFVASGAIAGGVAGEINAEFTPSTYAGLPAAGRIQIAGDRNRIAAADVHVTLGEAKLDAKGSLGRAGDALDIELHAPNLSVIAKPLGWNVAGSVDAQARLTGALSALAGRVSLKA